MAMINLRGSVIGKLMIVHAGGWESSPVRGARDAHAHRVRQELRPKAIPLTFIPLKKNAHLAERVCVSSSMHATFTQRSRRAPRKTTLWLIWSVVLLATTSLLAQQQIKDLSEASLE